MSENSEQSPSPLARYRRPGDRPKPPLRVGNGGNGIGLTAQQQMHADFDMASLRLSRTIPVELRIPPELILPNEAMATGFERCDVECFRQGLHAYQMAMWRWFESTPEGIAFKSGGVRK